MKDNIKAWNAQENSAICTKYGINYVQPDELKVKFVQMRQMERLIKLLSNEKYDEDPEPAKLYKCKICGAEGDEKGKFDTSTKLATHARMCKKKHAEKQAEAEELRNKIEEKKKEMEEEK